MSRRNRAVSPANAWNQLWHLFFPWVVGCADDSMAVSQQPKPRSKRQRQLVITAVCAFTLTLAQPVWAENDYGDFAKKPVSKAKQAPRQDEQVAEVEKPTLKLTPASLTTTSLPTSPSVSYPNLFGSNETRYEDLRPFTKWSGVLARFGHDFRKSEKQATTQRWLNFLNAAAELDHDDQVTAVNTYMNKIKFISDQDNYGRSDHWATPMQFLARGGDCEDYAIAKYVSLRALGFTEKQMRLAVVYDREMRMPHALLIVYQDGKAKVLDNQNPEVGQATQIRRYQPIYSINQLSWWRHG
jgi:predicted transglutaminase-like cysteine proteinase